MRFYGHSAFGTKWAAEKGVACNGSRLHAREQQVTETALCSVAATCLHFISCLSVSFFCGPFASDAFVLISPLLCTFSNRSNLLILVLLSTFFVFQYSFFLSPFFVFIRLRNSISYQFFPALPFLLFAFIFKCLPIFSCYLSMCLFLPLRICSLSLHLLPHLSPVFIFCFFCLIHFSVLPLSLLIFIYLYIFTSFYTSFSVLSLPVF